MTGMTTEDSGSLGITVMTRDDWDDWDDYGLLGMTRDN